MYADFRIILEIILFTNDIKNFKKVDKKIIKWITSICL